MRWIAAATAALLLAAPTTAADVVPVVVESLPNNVVKYMLCNAQTATGICKRGGSEIVLPMRGQFLVTLYSGQSTASSYSCDVYSNDEGGAAANGGQDITANPLTESAQVLAFEGLLDHIWVNCSAISGGNVTVTAIVAPR